MFLLIVAGTVTVVGASFTFAQPGELNPSTADRSREVFGTIARNLSARQDIGVRGGLACRTDPR